MNKQIKLKEEKAYQTMAQKLFEIKQIARTHSFNYQNKPVIGTWYQAMETEVLT